MGVPKPNTRYSYPLTWDYNEDTYDPTISSALARTYTTYVLAEVIRKAGGAYQQNRAQVDTPLLNFRPSQVNALVRGEIE